MTDNPSLTPSTRIYLFGGLRLRLDGQSIPLPGSKMKSLLAYLLLEHERPQQRETLVAHLWPDSDPERGRRNLSDVLYRLRQLLDGDWFESNQETIRIKPDVKLWVDVWAFTALARSGETADLEKALSLYQDPLLPELYDDWILEPRAAFQEKYRACLLRLAETAENNRQYRRGAAYYATLVRLDPLREDVVRGLMRVYAAQNRIVDALAVYRQLAQHLETELQLKPGQATRQLKRELALKQSIAASNAPAAPPFIGRVGERARLLQRLERAYAGGGGIAVVLGEAGIGKTRLLSEIEEAARWRGWQVASASGQEFDHRSAYAPLTGALAAALPRPRLQQLAQLTPTLWLALAARIAPHIGQTLDLPDLKPPPGGERWRAMALFHLCQGLQQIAPHLFLLDDVQWAAPDLWPLLADLHPLLANLSIMLVIAGRYNALRARPAVWRTLKAWDEAGEPIVRLSGLAPDALRLLAEKTSGAIEAERLERLVAASGGNPLAALTLLQEGDWDQIGEQPSLLALARRRLQAVSTPAHLALQAAAVIGYHFDYTTWAAILETVPAAELPSLAGELEGARLLQLAEDGYRFQHDTLRACVYGDTPVGRRRRLHQKMADYLVEKTPDHNLAILHHAEAAGDAAKIGRYALRAGEEALAGYTLSPAVAYFTQALHHLPENDPERRYTAVLGRIRAYHILAEREAEQQDLERLRRLAARLDAPAPRADAAYWRARFLWATDLPAEALPIAEEGLALAREAGDAARQADLLYLCGRLVRERGDYPQAEALVWEARQKYEMSASRLGVALTTDLLGGLAWAQGDYETAVSRHARAADLFQQLGDLFHEALALNNLGSAYWGAGDYEQARLTHERTVNINRELGHKRGEADNLDNLGGVAWVLGDYDTAVDYYNQALAIRRQIQDQWGISISLGNLGSAYRLQGKLETALQYFAEAQQANRQMGRKRGEGYNLHGRGLTLLAKEDAAGARRALAAAHAIRAELGERANLVETEAGLALAALAAGRPEEARRRLNDALEKLDAARDRDALQQWVHYAAFQAHEATGDEETAVFHLAAAAAAMERIAAPLSPPQRRRFREQVPLNRQIRAALEARSRTIQVRLVRAGVPLGRKLSDDDYVSGRWTIYAPGDEAVADKGDRRRRVLLRLLREAEAQDAAPTDSDLAEALKVSRRTILRDMEKLGEEGHALPTRRRARG